VTAPFAPTAPPAPAPFAPPASPAQPAPFAPPSPYAPFDPFAPSAGTPAHFGETTVLGGHSAGATTVLDQGIPMVVTPHLIRIKNNERITLSKPLFRVGKEKSFADYFIGDNPAISRNHAEFSQRDGEYYVTDMNSTNHTYLNGVMVQSSVDVRLAHGDSIKFANEEFMFKLS
ncbi:MAG: FHA domain-containing protein, partial [Oscillospiraceae bacterium]|nr:FHA domain-containing protein [Oscillospiraceae bacterium]